MKKVHYEIICVGAGGTGGNFLKELGRFLKFFYEEDVSWDLHVIDGDTVEEKNAERQPFLSTDVMQHKASLMTEGLVDCLGLPADRVEAITVYLDTVEQLKDILGYCYRDTVYILVGAVDNHRARQVMHDFYNERNNCIYLDSANEFEEGEIVVGVRINGKEIAPPRGYYFPEVLTDKGKRASELSCGAINISAPQHLVTNLTAAQHLLSFVVGIMRNHKIEGGVLHFNAFSHYCRFDRWTAEMQEEKDAREGKVKKKAGRPRKKVVA